MESKGKTIKIDKAKYSGFLKKAKEFISSMEDDLAKERWNSACLNAIHSAISANDALLACFHGIRSISPKHDDAVRLLISLFKTEEARKNAEHLQELIRRKNLLEYQDKLFSGSDAGTLSKHARRFLEWAQSILP